MINRKIKYFTTRDVFTNKVMKYAKVTIFNEPMNIRGLKFNMANVYNVPAEDINDSNLYQQPINNPRYNVDRAFNIYRSKMGLLNPKQIKHERKTLHLSQADVSAILGISYSTLSRIENNHVIQSISQDTELRNLFNISSLVQLIKARLPAIKTKHNNKIKISNLANIIKKYNRAKQKQPFNLISKLPLKDMIIDYCKSNHLTQDQLANNSHISKSIIDRLCKTK